MKNLIKQKLIWLDYSLMMNLLCFAKICLTGADALFCWKFHDFGSLILTLNLSRMSLEASLWSICRFGREDFHDVNVWLTKNGFVKWSVSCLGRVLWRRFASIDRRQTLDTLDSFLVFSSSVIKDVLKGFASPINIFVKAKGILEFFQVLRMRLFLFWF